MPAIQYEVTASIRKDLCDSFESFMMKVHIPEVMETGAFSNAYFATITSGKYRASYISHSQEALAKYLVEHSPSLREDVAERFPDGVEFSREEWTILASF